jgi:hypothetical protein
VNLVEDMAARTPRRWLECTSVDTGTEESPTDLNSATPHHRRCYFFSLLDTHYTKIHQFSGFHRPPVDVGGLRTPQKAA